MITEDYVSFEIAKLLKEKGFNVPCIAHWFIGTDRNFSISNTPQNWNEIKTDLDWLSCPTHQMAMKWLREVHNYHTEIERSFEYFHNGIMHKPSYDAVVQDIANKDMNFFVAECNTYEEAVEAALKYCLENLI